MAHQIFSRIVDFTEHSIADLSFSPKMPYGHSIRQLSGLSASLKVLGLLSSIVVNKHTSNILSGTQLVKIFDYNSIEKIPATIIDVSEEEEAEILLVMKAIEKSAYLDRKIAEQTIASKPPTRLHQKLRDHLGQQNLLPLNGTKLWSDSQIKSLPLSKQRFAEYQVAYLDKEVWQLGDAEIIGTPEECSIIVNAWEKSTNKKANKKEIR